MLVKEMLVAGFFFAGDRDLPTSAFHQGFDAGDGIFEKIMAIEMGRILNQVLIADIPPGFVISDPGNVPSGVIDGFGDALNNLHRSRHRDHLLSIVFWIWIERQGWGAIILMC